MAKNLRVSAVPREDIDIDKLVSGLMLLLEQLSAKSDDDTSTIETREHGGTDSEAET